MRMLRLALCILTLTLLASGVEAKVVDPVSVGLKDVIATVEEAFKPDRTGISPLSDVVADFFQRSTIVGKGKEMRADGQMFLKTATASEPLMFRFDYYRPTSQEIVCDGKTLWIHLRENRQVIISDVSEFFNPHRFDVNRDRAVNFLQGLGRISKDFEVIFSPQRVDQAGNFILELTPRRASVSIEKLFMVVSRDAAMRHTFVKQGRNDFAPNRQELQFPILSTTVIDHEGNQTTMEFSNVKTNSRLPDLIFYFSVPPGINVVQPPNRR